MILVRRWFWCDNPNNDYVNQIKGKNVLRMIDDITAVLDKFGPAFVGALISARWLNGTWPQKLFMIASGIALSAVLSPWLADVTSIPEYAVGALTGLFGIAIADGLYRAWNDINLGVLLREIIRAKFGLTGRDKHD